MRSENFGLTYSDSLEYQTTQGRLQGFRGDTQGASEERPVQNDRTRNTPRGQQSLDEAGCIRHVAKCLQEGGWRVSGSSADGDALSSCFSTMLLPVQLCSCPLKSIKGRDPQLRLLVTALPTHTLYFSCQCLDLPEFLHVYKRRRRMTNEEFSIS